MCRRSLFSGGFRAGGAKARAIPYCIRVLGASRGHVASLAAILSSAASKPNAMLPMPPFGLAIAPNNHFNKTKCYCF